MIPRSLNAEAEATQPFITRLRLGAATDAADSQLVSESDGESVFAGRHGLFAVETQDQDIDGDVVLLDPQGYRADRILRASSPHNTLLITERCDQLCVMCSQPPKKTHVDRFKYFQEACLLAPEGMIIGISGGEPTLYKEQLLGLVETTLQARPDLGFHILSNGQHFEAADIERLRAPAFRTVTWGIPLYSSDPAKHDAIVAKPGAFERLVDSFGFLLSAGARVELRTVVMSTTVPGMVDLSRLVAAKLGFIETWSIMQLENIGFAKNRWGHLYYDHSTGFEPIAEALNVAQLNGIRARLFNFPLCTVPAHYRHLAPASISDWKRKYALACEGCGAKESCSGFFEWHPDGEIIGRVKPL